MNSVPSSDPVATWPFSGSDVRVELLRSGPCQHLVLMIQYRGVDQTVGFFRRTQRHIQHQDVFLQYERPAFLRQAARGSRPMLVERIAGLDRCGSIKQKAGGMRGDTDHNAHQKSLPAAPHKFGFWLMPRVIFTKVVLVYSFSFTSVSVATSATDMVAPLLP